MRAVSIWRQYEKIAIYTDYFTVSELPETFIDSVHSAFFDGVTFRLELCATRMDEPKPAQPQSAKQYPICRLIMPPQAMLEVYNQLQGLVNMLIQQGVLKPLINPPEQKQH
jgi:hypothetical protein